MCSSVVDAAALAPGVCQEQFAAPLRLKTESYAEFRKLLPSLGSEHEARENILEGLRQSGIDPEVFYQSVSAAAAAATDGATAGVRRRGAGPLEVAVYDPDDSAPISFDPLSRAAAVSAARELKGQEDGEQRAREGRPCGTEAQEAHQMETKADRLTSEWRSVELQPPGVPEGLEELDLDACAETRGGRFGHETPKGMESRLQIDSLTDDEDDPIVCLRGSANGRPATKGEEDSDSEDAVGSFTLDPDFDYDNVRNLTRKF